MSKTQELCIGMFVTNKDKDFINNIENTQETI